MGSDFLGGAVDWMMLGRQVPIRQNVANRKWETAGSSADSSPSPAPSLFCGLPRHVAAPYTSGEVLMSNYSVSLMAFVTCWPSKEDCTPLLCLSVCPHSYLSTWLSRARTAQIKCQSFQSLPRALLSIELEYRYIFFSIPK